MQIPSLPRANSDLRHSYLISFFSIVLLIISLQFITYLEEEIEREEMIFMRMAESQRLQQRQMEELVNSLVSQTGEPVQQKQELLRLHEMWSSGHQALFSSNSPVEHLPELKAQVAYFLPEAQQHKNSISYAMLQLNGADSATSFADKHSKAFFSNGKAYLEIIDRLIFHCHFIAESGQQSLQLYQRLAAVAILLIILLQLLYIFRPLNVKWQQSRDMLTHLYRENIVLTNDLSSVRERLHKAEEEKVALSRRLEEIKAEAEAASQAKAQLYADLAQKMTHPAEVLINSANQLLDEKSAEAQKKSLQTLKQSEDRLFVLLRELLNISSQEAGKLRWEVKAFSFEDMLLQIRKNHESLASEKGIYLNIETDKSLPSLLYGDAFRISQVLDKLVANAVRFTLQGGVVLKIEKKHAFDHQVEVQFTVEDTGIGIAAEKLEMMQKADMAKDAAVREKQGFGLHFIQQLLASQESQIRLVSEPGKGSRFFFSLKLNTQPSSDENTSSKPDFQNKHEHNKGIQ